MERGTASENVSSSSVTDTRDNFSEILDKVSGAASEWIVTKNGRPTAVIVDFHEYMSLLETLNILSDPEAMASLEIAETEIVNGELESIDE